MQRHQGLAAKLAASALLVCGVPAASAASFASLYSFASAHGGVGDANNPYAGLVIDSAGNLYGTTYGGGAECEGAVYEVSPPAAGGGAWTETVLYSFYAGNRTDGVKPTGRLALGGHGELYGTTSAAGGAASNGHGTVFELAPPASPGGAWSETTLHVFTGAKGDGATPYAGLAVDASGNLYGTTFEGGGTAGKDGPGFGAVFKLAPPAGGQTGWTETILYSFADTARDGISPQSDLLLSGSGALFGTTPGCSSKLSCAGTLFELLPQAGGWTETLVAALPASGNSGAGPNGGLAIDSAGNLYGTTSIGTGVAFRAAPPEAGETKWKLTVLARFKSDRTGGPQGGVLVAPGGVLFGTVTYGPRKSGGSIYELLPPSGNGPWTNTTIYSFAAKPAGGGVFPVGGLVADGHGDLYGVTETGGVGGVGSVFEVTP